MKLLFVHRVFPGQFLHLLRSLAVSKEHDLVFITATPGAQIPGVVTVPYLIAPLSDHTHPNARDFELSVRRAEAVAQVAHGLRVAGFTPDIVIGHESWGELLNMQDVWPGVPEIAYREYFYHLSGADVGCDPEFPLRPEQIPALRTKNAALLLGLQGDAIGASPTAWQRDLYPDWARDHIFCVPDGVPLDLCRPDPQCRTASVSIGSSIIPPDGKLVTFAARDLEPYRGFHTFMRAVPRLLEQSNLHVVCVGGDGVSYGLPPAAGNWRQVLLAELGSIPEIERLHFTGRIPYADHIRVLQRSDVHAYLSYPFIPSWSLREALACGCAVVAADTAPVRELTEDGRAASLVPPLDPNAAADMILALLADDTRRARLSHAARLWAQRSMALQGHLGAWYALINRCVENGSGRKTQLPQALSSQL